MKTQSFSVKTNDGLHLIGQCWENKPPESLLFLIHGLGEHQGRYQDFARFLTDQGIVIMSLDLRGHGKSEGKKGHTPSLDILLDDIGLLLKKGEDYFPGIPRFLFGHSMGGNLVLNYLLRRKPPLSGVIAGSPWIGLPNPPSAILVALSRILYKLIPTFTQDNGLDQYKLTRNKEATQAIIQDPLGHTRVSVSTGKHMLDAAGYLSKYSGQVDIPLLLMHGSDDHITDFHSTKALAGRLAGQVTFKEWPDAYHELHNEPEREEVFGYLAEWMKKGLSKEY